MAFQAGDVLGPFRLDRPMRRDASMVVWAATVLDTDQPVTVTTLMVPVEQRAAVLERLAATAELGEHRNVGVPAQWGEFDAGVFYAWDLAESVWLDELLRRQPAGRPLAVGESLDLLADVAHGIDAVHGAGFVHGALSASTVAVTLTRPRRAVIVDVGLAPLADETSGASEPGPRDDVAAFARLAAQLLASGRRDLPPEVGSILESLESRSDGPVVWCLDVVAELRRVLGPATPVAAQLFDQTTGSPSASKCRRRSRGWMAAAGAVAVAFGGAVAIAVNRSSGVAGDVDQLDTTTTPPSTSTTTTTTSTTTSTSTTSTSVAATASTIGVTSTVPVGVFGFRDGAVVDAATGPESAFALAVAGRGDPHLVAVEGSPAFFYLQWIRTAPLAGGQPVTATIDGFSVTADRPVVLANLAVVDGLVSGFDECVADVCTPIGAAVSVPDPACSPGPGCPHVRSTAGAVTAWQRATLTMRWPVQVLVYQLDAPRRSIVTVDEPNGRVRYDAATGYLVAVLPDRPVPGTRDDLTVRFDDDTSDIITIIYG